MTKFREALEKALEFDNVIEILDDGTFIERPDLYAPELYNDNIESDHWKFWSYGRTNQYGYNGPMLHNSETWSLSMLHDLERSPGIYVCVYGTYDNDDLEFIEVEPTIIEGWCVLEYSESPIVQPVEDESDPSDVFDINDIDTAELPDTPEHN